MADLTLRQMGADVEAFTAQFDPQYWPPADIMLRASEEMGELAREVNHRFGSKPKKSSEAPGDLGEEMVGIIYALVCLANSQGVDLESAWRKEIDKYNHRDAGRFKAAA